MEEGELQRALEAILFAAGEPVEVAPAGHDAGNGPQRH